MKVEIIHSSVVLVGVVLRERAPLMPRLRKLVQTAIAVLILAVVVLLVRLHLAVSDDADVYGLFRNGS